MSAVTASLCSTLLFVGLFVFVSADQENITAKSGQNVTLTCRAPNSNIRAIEWSRADLGDKYVLLYRDGHFDAANQHPSFKNRSDLQDRQMKDGDVSLILKNVMTADNGTYKCRVIMSGTNNEHICNITLSVVDPPGQTGGDTEDGSVGLIVGLVVSAVLLLAVVVGFLIYRKHQKGVL
ncbi:selection and upkeep of intraepithelial T-cells protein 7-like [Oreochromis aureus]|uniref:selection and upkeep of intraepithelial T-cells protein 7-like n=1 Tax=Oreochromis aureus TaxID=47969 RepID=UPI0019545F86|nr:selection and upkeep of intraepithelial T-cells protein 7-like [Oreochromis aureus]